MIDGIIKYQISHSEKPMPLFENYSSQEALRIRLFALGLIGETDEGIGYGNLSYRHSESSFFITASQTGKHPSLEVNQYTFVDSYELAKFRVNSCGPFKPSSEALSHAMIYELHSEINAVIHIHSAELWRWMIRREALATTAEYGTEEMIEEIAKLYKNRDLFEENIFVMKGHEDGIISFGRSIEEAETKLYENLQHLLQYYFVC